MLANVFKITITNWQKFCQREVVRFEDKKKQHDMSQTLSAGGSHG